MAKLKYQIKEFTPNAAQVQNGQGHSFYAEEIVDHVITNDDLAKKIEARSGFRRYEVKAILEAAAEITLEELLESNRVQLSFEDGVWVSMKPECKGSVSDKDILAKTTAAHALDASVPVRSVATEADVTPELLHWTITGNMGPKFAQEFNRKKSIQKVKAGNVTTVVEETTTPQGGGDNNGGGSGSEEIG